MAVNKQDIGLLFGVLGGGRISGESGSLIKSQLDSIVKSLNNDTNAKQRRIRLNLDVAKTRNSFSTDLKKITDGLSGQKKFKITVSEINATSAINKLKSEINTVLKTLRVGTGFDVSLGTNGAGQLEQIKLTFEAIREQYKSIISSRVPLTDAADVANVNSLRIGFAQLAQSIYDIENGATPATEETFARIAGEESAVRSLIRTLLESIDVKKKAAKESDANAAKAQRAAEKEAKAETDVLAMRKEAITLQKRMASALNNFSKASNTTWYQTISAGKEELDAMLSGATSLNRTKLNNLIDSFNESEGAIRGAGLATKSLGDTIVANAKKFSTWFGVQSIIMRLVRAIRSMIDTVIELDTAMTELKKVTDETDTAYTNFLTNASSRAKELGTTISDLINASAEFARLGYGLSDSASLADAAVVYKNVGDGIDDISTAAESIISTMQSFGIEAENAMLIVDAFNEVGNNFAISSKGIGEALLRSASAMKSAGNSMEETIALAAAANTIIQNPESVGKNLPNNAVMRCKKTAISVKGRRRLRPRKDFVVCARRVRSSTSFCYTPEVITTAQKTGVYIQCEYCGKMVYKTLSQYKKRKQHFCSNKCQSLLKREITFEHRPCEVCGEDMYISKKSTQRFCSNECQHIWQLGNTGFNNKRFQGGYVRCESCDKEFLVGKYLLDSNRKHFCSTSCRQTWYSTVWSQSEAWRLESRERAAHILQNNPVITQTKPQVIANVLLEELDVSYRNEEPFVYYSIDNYLPEFDLAIEVMGDYWHSSPLKYPKSINDRQRHIVSRDKAKHTYLKNYYGIEVLYLWESDLLQRPEVCSKLIRHYIESGGNIQNYHSFNYSVVDDRLELNDVIVCPYQERRIETAC